MRVRVVVAYMRVYVRSVVYVYACACAWCSVLYSMYILYIGIFCDLCVVCGVVYVYPIVGVCAWCSVRICMCVYMCVV